MTCIDRLRLRTAAVGLGVAWLLGACAALAPKFEHPRLSVVSVEIRDASLSEQHLRVKMRVMNPNSMALPIEGINYTIQLGDEELGRGVTADSFTVPPQGEAEFDMLMTTNLAATFFKVLPRLKDTQHPLEYRVVGKVRTGMTFLRSIPFDEKGVLPAR
jgi:LEA14-like dessication related protein